MATEWLLLKNFLALPALITGARLEAALPPVGKARWMALVFEGEADAPKPYVDPPGISRFTKTKWRTISSDGDHLRSYDGLIARLGHHLFKVRTQQITKTKAHLCAEGRIWARYREQYLEAEPIAGGRARPLWRAPDAKFFKFCDCEFVESPLEQQVQSEETSELSVQSIINDSISIDAVTDEFNIAATSPHGGRVWQTLKINGNSLKPQKIHHSILRLADLEFMRALKSDRVAIDYDRRYVDCQGFLVLPWRGGVVVEFQCGSRFDPFDRSSYPVRVEQPYGLGDSYSKMCHSFLKEHQSLIDWQKVDFYTVAPDRSVVVFAHGNDLYWKSVTTGEQIPLGTVKQIRGWQWVDKTRLYDKEIAALAA